VFPEGASDLVGSCLRAGPYFFARQLGFQVLGNVFLNSRILDMIMQRFDLEICFRLHCMLTT
jgi:hypothetical protein